MKILLTDGNQRSTLAATRSLGKVGYKVIVGEECFPNLSGVSKYCSDYFVYPSPYKNEQKYFKKIVNVIEEESIDLVIPTTDISSAILTQNKNKMPVSVKIAVPDQETFWAASDKNTLHHLAEGINIPTPTLYYIEDRKNLDEIQDKIEFPCILKPSRSSVYINQKWLKSSVIMVRDRTEFRDVVRNNEVYKKPFMIQKVVKGEGFGVFALCDKGSIKAMFAHRRIREKPPWGGVSVLRESVPVNPQIRKYATELLSTLNWHGIAMVEFKQDAVCNKYYLMEINARLWGSLQLAIDAGVDFPVLLTKLYSGEEVPSNQEYRYGIRSRWLLGDIDHLLARLFKPLKTNGSVEPLWRFLLDFIKIRQKGMFYEIESLDDPRPSIYEIKMYIQYLSSNIYRRITR